MGFAAGLNAGSNMVNNIYATRNRREELQQHAKQQELQAAQAGYTYEGTSYQPTEATLQKQNAEASQYKILNDKLQAQEQAIQAQEGYINANTIKDLVLDWTSGKQNDALTKLNLNKPLVEKLKNSPSMQYLKLDTPNFNNSDVQKQLSDLGVDTSKLNDTEIKDALSRSFIQATKVDGSIELLPVDKLIAATNSHNYMTSEEQNTLVKNYQTIEAMTKGLRPQDIEQSNTIKDNEFEAFKKWSNANPNGTYAKFKESQITLGKDKELVKDYEANKSKYTDFVDYLSKLSTSTSSSRRDDLEQLVQTYEMKIGKTRKNWNRQDMEAFANTAWAKKTEGVGGVKETNDVNQLTNLVQTNNQLLKDNKMDTNTAIANEQAYLKQAPEKTELVKVQTAINGSIGTVKQIDNILNGAAIPIDKDLVRNAQDYLTKIFGKEDAQTFKNTNYDTQVGMVLANYLKATSGLAVTNEERAFLTKLLTSGSFSDEKYQKAALEDFKDFLATQTIKNADTYKDKLPYTYLKAKSLTEGETKEYNGMTYEKQGDTWVRIK